MTKPDFLAILRTLAKHQVDFVVVGGVCAVLHGAPVATFDLDLVHSRAPGNLTRLLTALEALDAYYRGQGERRIKPDLSHLATPGHQLLMTSAGPLDLLGEIGRGRGYDELIRRTTQIQIGDNLTVFLLDLDLLITTKEEIARDKDKAVLAVLRRTLEEKSRH